MKSLIFTITTAAIAAGLSSEVAPRELHTPFTESVSGCGHCHSCETDDNGTGHDFHEGAAPTPNAGTNHPCFAGGGTCLGHLDCESGGGGDDPELPVGPGFADVSRRDRFNAEILALPLDGVTLSDLRAAIAIEPERVRVDAQRGVVHISSSCDRRFLIAQFPLREGRDGVTLGD